MTGVDTKDKKRGQVCPACGRPTGGYVPCPHCGADPKIRTTMKFVLLICGIVLVFGIIYYSVHLSTLDPQPVAIADIDQWMDYSYVWIGGVMTSGPKYAATSVLFVVNDGTGDINVEIYDPAYSDMISEGKLPCVGDTVKLFGQLRVTDDVEIRPTSIDDVQVTRAEAVETTIDQVRTNWGTEDSLLNKRISLEATVTGVISLSSANIYTLEDNSAGYKVDMQMYVHSGLEAYQGKSLDINVLDRVRVTAGLSRYQSNPPYDVGTPQLAIADNEEVEVIGREEPLETPLASIDTSMLDDFAMIQGNIVFVELVGATGTDSGLELQGRYLWLDNKYNSRVWIYYSVYKLLSSDIQNQLTPGTQMEFIGRVSRTFVETAGVLKPQIDFGWPQELELTSGTYEPSLVENFAILLDGDIDSLNDDLVKIEGTVVGIEDIPVSGLPPHKQITIQDSFGNEIGIKILNIVYERMLDLPAVGEIIQVTGKIIDDAGAAVVQPGIMSDIQVVS